jgi:hypothetical protein
MESKQAAFRFPFEVALTQQGQDKYVQTVAFPRSTPTGAIEHIVSIPKIISLLTVSGFKVLLLSDQKFNIQRYWGAEIHTGS